VHRLPRSVAIMEGNVVLEHPIISSATCATTAARIDRRACALPRDLGRSELARVIEGSRGGMYGQIVW
jgi:hypothetical protein